MQNIKTTMQRDEMNQNRESEPGQSTEPGAWALLSSGKDIEVGRESTNIVLIKSTTKALGGEHNQHNKNISNRSVRSPSPTRSSIRAGRSRHSKYAQLDDDEASICSQSTQKSVKSLGFPKMSQRNDYIDHADNNEAADTKSVCSQSSNRRVRSPSPTSISHKIGRSKHSEYAPLDDAGDDDAGEAIVRSQSIQKSDKSLGFSRMSQRNDRRPGKHAGNNETDDAKSVCSQLSNKSSRLPNVSISLPRKRRSKHSTNKNLDDDEEEEALLRSQSTQKSVRSLGFPRISRRNDRRPNKHADSNEADDAKSVCSQLSNRSSRSLSVTRSLRRIPHSKHSTNKNIDDDNNNNEPSVCSQSTQKSVRSLGFPRISRRKDRSKYTNNNEADDAKSVCSQLSDRSSRSLSVTRSLRRIAHSKLFSRKSITGDGASVCSQSSQRSLRSLGFSFKRPRVSPRKNRNKSKSQGKIEKKNKKHTSTFDGNSISDDSFSDESSSDDTEVEERKLGKYYESDDGDYKEHFCTDVSEFCDYWSQSCDEILGFIFVLGNDSSLKDQKV